jgi:CHAT domain-containing protein
MHARSYLYWPLLVLVVAIAAPSGPWHARAAPLVPPPRTIADITAILDQEKPDTERVSQVRAAADAEPPGTADADTLVEFLYNRAVARSDLGRFTEAIADSKAGIALGAEKHVDVVYTRLLLGFEYDWSGDTKSALEVFLNLARDSQSPQTRRYLFTAYRWISFEFIGMGDIDQAESYHQKIEALLIEAQAWPEFAPNESRFSAEVDYCRGRLFEARGRLREAEAAYYNAEIHYTELMVQMATGPDASRRWGVAVVRDNMIASQGVVKAKQGRFAEGEADVRRALLNRLSWAGKYNLPTTSLMLPRFAQILLDQGRYAEAEQLHRAQIEIYQTLGVSKDSQYFVKALSRIASLQALRGQWREAAETYATIDEATKSWQAARRQQLENVDRVLAFYNTGHLSEGVAAAEQLLAQSETLLGADHADTAYARAALALGLYRAGRYDEAQSAFGRAIPILLTDAQETEQGDGVAAREQRRTLLIESYMSLLSHTVQTSGTAGEIFTLADAIRSRSVQRALSQSSARAAAGNPELAELARHEQDLAKQIAAQLGLLNNLLAKPKEQRGEAAVQNLQTEIDRLRLDLEVARKELAQGLPAYAQLIDPKAPTVGEIKAVLKADEAFVSFYFGTQQSFVWAISAQKPPAFAVINMSADDIAIEVKKLRAALEPRGALISYIPPFDVAVAHELYRRLLQPVEAGWKDAKSLIVVTNGALGELPLSLLPTAPSRVDPKAEPLFTDYRNVTWLARSHAVTAIPSAAAFVMLRHLPPGSLAREPLIGFGDPYFNEQQAAEAEHELGKAAQVAFAGEGGGNTVTRGIPIMLRASPHTEDLGSARLAMLPRLPDTRQELLAIATALKADLRKALYLGKDANERNVETIDLSHFRIVAFATHGLVPGDLDGLTQPALALTAPEVAGVNGDGLLTMEKILALKLNADWVVLSACNTAAGAGAGAEAASGLGSAFFYAGTRALLVTNWSVESASARELIADLFRRQSAEPNLSRSEALRQAMIALLDGAGVVDQSGHTIYTYAHPFFWAPYSVIGDGSAN